MLCIYPRNAASSVTPATTDCIAISRKAVTKGMSNGVVIGGDEGRGTRRAATEMSASSVANPGTPAASDARHTLGGRPLALRFARRAGTVRAPRTADDTPIHP